MESPLRLNPPASAALPVTRPGSGAEAQERGVATYDLLGAARFSPDLMILLADGAGRMAQQLAADLSRSLRLDVSVTVAAVREAPYVRQTQGLLQQAYAFALLMPPLPAKALLALDRVLAFVCLDRLMGGVGQSSPDTQRELTEIECGLAAMILKAMSGAIAAAWDGVAKLTPRTGEQLTESALKRLALPGDPSVVIALDMAIRESKGQLRIVMPAPMVKQLGLAAGAETRPAAFEPNNVTPAAQLRRHVEAATVPLVAELGRCKVTMRDLLELRPGDVLRLQSRVTHDLTISMGGREAYRGRPGRVSERIAIQITAVTKEYRNAGE
jgi:flagellar motor switch protein FliM